MTKNCYGDTRDWNACFNPEYPVCPEWLGLYRHVIEQAIRWEIRETPLSSLLARIYTLDGERVVGLRETPASRFLSGEEEVLERYYRFLNENCYPNAKYSVKRFKTLFQSIRAKGFDPSQLIVTFDNSWLPATVWGEIADGQHRASILAHLNGLNSTVPIFNIVRD